MNEFEEYSYSRLFVDRNLEFFVIMGVNNADDFTYYWDQRLTEVVGYAVVYTNHKQKKQENIIYLVDKDIRDFEKIIKYTKLFVSQMYLSIEYSNEENFEIHKTNINGKFIKTPYIDFVKKIIVEDIPSEILAEMDSKI